MQLGTEHEPIKDVLEYARPIMSRLAEKTSMACHVAVESQEQIVVIARVETPASLSYSVRVGYRRPIVHAASGKLLFAFQKVEKKESIMKLLQQHHSEKELNTFLSECKKFTNSGYLKGTSAFVKGVTAISITIMDGDQTVATFSLPFL